MLKLIAVLALVAVCYAQPKRPVIKETFIMRGEAEEHGDDKTLFGEMVIAEDSANMEILFNLSFRIAEKREDAVTVELFAKKMRYIELLSDGALVNCTHEALTYEYHPFFDWVQYANFLENRTIRHRDYNIWAFQYKEFYLEVAVDPEIDNNRPVYFNYMEKGAQLVDLRMLIRDITDMTPPQSMFNVPSACDMKPRSDMPKRVPMVNIRPHLN